MDAFANIAIKLSESFSALAQSVKSAFIDPGFIEYFQETGQLLAVASDRQRWLLLHGRPKVRKKWRNALRRKIRIAEKKPAERAGEEVR